MGVASPSRSAGTANLCNMVAMARSNASWFLPRRENFPTMAAMSPAATGPEQGMS